VQPPDDSHRPTAAPCARDATSPGAGAIRDDHVRSRGTPLYVQGPHDDPIAIVETLLATIGRDGFSVAA
jgi:hypothetical protein